MAVVANESVDEASAAAKAAARCAGTMSKSKRRDARRRAFFAASPTCCYCGTRPAVTVDHAPARACFKGRVGPEHFEVPACGECNSTVSATEQIVALYARMFDHEERHLEIDDLSKLIVGVDNNASGCLPRLRPYISANEHRRELRTIGQSRPPGVFLKDIPLADVPNEAQPHFDIFGRKMLAAIYFIETGKILGPDHWLLTNWSQHGSEAARFTVERANEWFGEFRVGRRANVDLGSQFSYRFGYNEAHRFFGSSMQFGQGIGFFCVAGPAEQMATLRAPSAVSPWLPLDELVATRLAKPCP